MQPNGFGYYWASLVEDRSKRAIVKVLQVNGDLMVAVFHDKGPHYFHTLDEFTDWTGPILEPGR